MQTFPRATLRVTTSVRANFLSVLQEKTYFFYFTHSLLQNTHISLSILHIYLIKYSFFLHFLLFPSLSSLAQTHHLVFSVHTHTQPATLQQNLAIDSPIFHNNNHNNNDNNNDSPIFHNNDTITITTTLTHSPSMSDQFSITVSISKRIVWSERLIGVPNSLAAQTRRLDSVRGAWDLSRAIVIFVFPEILKKKEKLIGFAKLRWEKERVEMKVKRRREKKLIK